MPSSGISALIQSLLQNDLLQACCSAFRNVEMAELVRMLMDPRLVVENHQQMLSCYKKCDEAVDGVPSSGRKPFTDALLSAESARLPLALATCPFGGTLLVTLMPVLLLL